MNITDTELQHFQTHGFFFVPNPFGEEGMRKLDRISQDNEAEWEATDWPKGFNRLACQFLMLGEPILQFVEQPQFLEAGRKLLGCEEIHVGACGSGDASKVVSEDGRPVRQVHWHSDGGPDVHQVAFRTALDRHDSSNAPLRVLPGSHRRPREEVQCELMQLEIATGRHDTKPDKWSAEHPLEVSIILDPRWTLVWTPSCWHATGVKTAAGPRRAFGWNYFPKGGRKRDIEAVKHIFHGQWRAWTDERKFLWGIDE